MQSQKILFDKGFVPVTYSDVIFKHDSIAGTCSVERGDKNLYKAVAITLQDNEVDESDLEACILDYETVKEIAYTTDTLYTNYGIGVHSSSFKSKPFSNLKIVKI